MNYVEIIRAFYLYGGPVLMLVGTVGNVLAGVVVVRSKELWKYTTSLYILALAVVDTVLLDSMIIIHMIDAANSKGNLNVFLESRALCKLQAYLVNALYANEAWILVQISLERLVAVILPHKFKTLFTKSRSLLVLSVIFIMICCYCSFVFVVVDYVDDEHTCTIIPSKKWIYDTCTSVLIILFIFVPLMLLTGTSVTLVWRLRQRSSGNPSSITAMMVAVVIIYLIIAIPHNIYWMIGKFHLKGQRPSNTFLLVENALYILQYLNCVINFYVYCLGNAVFRRELVKMFKGIRSTKRRCSKPEGTEVAMLSKRGSKTAI